MAALASYRDEALLKESLCLDPLLSASAADVRVAGHGGARRPRVRPTALVLRRRNFGLKQPVELDRVAEPRSRRELLPSS